MFQKFLFWFALTCETIAVGWFLYNLSKVKERYVPEAHWDMMRKELYPAIVLSIIVVAALVARYYFNMPRVSLVIAYAPAIMFALGMIFLTLGAMLSGGNWR